MNMELHNNQVPGDTVWAVLIDFGDRGVINIDWYLTPEASSGEYRHVMEYMKTHSGGTCQRYKVTLPRQRMEREEVDTHVEYTLLVEPDGTAQLLDVGHHTPKD
jgi:hypothetical protein